MKITKLISLSDFVPTLESLSHSEYRKLMNNYHRFLKQPLTLSMFVPCDDEGNVLEEPNEDNSNYWNIGVDGKFNNGYFGKDYENYQEAKSKVLFEGFESMETRRLGSWQIKLINSRHNIDTIKNDAFGMFYYNSRNEKQRINTIEDLLMFNYLTLSETALKQIYG